ncbi:MAG: hypothetical protein Q4A69_05565 [Moraxella sp.]|nr:hypothetical protein [Moraxella sp.]
MYKALLIALALCAQITYGADWTPAFRYLEVGKGGDGGKALYAIMGSVFKDGAGDEGHPQYKQILRQPLTNAAKTGKYSNVPAPYRHDMLPAKLSNQQDMHLHATIELKNATLYGLPLQSVSYYYACSNCGNIGFYATFKPMTKQAYQKLVKNVKFRVDDESCSDGAMAGFYGRPQEVILALAIGC